MIRRIANKIRAQGVQSVIEAIIARTVPRRAKAWNAFREELEGGNGLEVGGPSAYFSRNGRMPVYAVAGSLDNCNFAAETLWEGNITRDAGSVLARRGVTGRQHVAEATGLNFAGTGQYDFLLSSHTLEHVANPIAGLREWMRVVKDGGLLVLVLPHREGTFDHRRPVTRMDHLLQDEATGIQESDLTHLDEILRLHDFDRDPGAGSHDEFHARSHDNLRTRALHHHVFDTRLACELVDHVGLEIQAVEPTRPYDILIVCRKSPSRGNTRFLAKGKARAWASPFTGDRD